MADTTEAELDEIGQLFQICSSLTNKALEMPTITGPKLNNDDGECSVGREKRIGRWLDSQILDYESRLYTNTEASNDSIPCIEVWRCLIDYTARLSREKLILKGLVHNRVSQNEDLGDGKHQLRQDIRKEIQRESLAVQEKQRTLESIRSDIRLETIKLDKQKMEYTAAWEQLAARERPKGKKPSRGNKTSRRVIQQRLVSDLVASVDLETDDRLRTILETIE